jgi:hypothetical protein
MTAVAYAMADLAPSRDGNVPPGAVAVPTSRGGCGVSHEIGLDDAGRPCITCDTCVPILVGGVYGWGATPHAVPLTPDELAQRELAKRDVEASQAVLMNAMVHDWMGKLSQQAPAAIAPAPSVADVLAKASPEELLAALPPEMREALAQAAAAKALEGKDDAQVKPRTPRSRKD